MRGYDKHYETPDLFGNAYPELLAYFQKKSPSRILDLGCGQGRDALPLAKMGHYVMGVDLSATGINQMLQVAEQEGLQIEAHISDCESFDNFSVFDYVLFDSMFHFTDKSKAKELELLVNAISGMRSKAELVICIQNSPKKVEQLLTTVKQSEVMKLVEDRQFEHRFRFEGQETKTAYKMLIWRKI